MGAARPDAEGTAVCVRNESTDEGAQVSRRFPEKLVTALSFSGGRGSTCLLAMVLDGEIPRPRNFIVLNADPGMENTETYAIVAEYEAECKRHGIPFLRTRRNLYEEILALKSSKKTRFDTPPLWTKDPVTGKRGRLLQKCTYAYKIAPMDRALRLWMDETLGVPKTSKNIGTGTVSKWIGFSDDEWSRVKTPRVKYTVFEYPLIDRRMKDADLSAYLYKAGRRVPPRSVCSGCYANDVGYFKQMFIERPHNWDQAVAIDDAIRDLTQIGVRHECFVSSTLVPLRVMAAMNFENLQDQELVACHTGHCFV